MTKIFDIKKEVPHITLLVLLLLFMVIASPYLSDKLPTHWNIAGEIDNYQSKTEALALLGALNVGLYALLSFIPFVDPRKEKYAQFIKIYRLFKLLLIVFFGIVTVLILLSGLGYAVPMTIVMPLMVGGLFIFLGNYMGKIKQNYFLGIRIPWTLADEDNWNKTHRFGGKVFFVSGIVIVLSGILTPAVAYQVLLGTILVIIFLPMIYSWNLARRKIT